MQRIAVELGLDPLDVIRRNLVPADAFPVSHRQRGLARLRRLSARRSGAAVGEGGSRRTASRGATRRAREGRLYGIGYAAVVEPSVSNMGYITTVLTPEERRKAGPKNGAQATATIALDPLGSVSVHVASVPQGQGHRTVLSQVVADVLGLDARRHPRQHRDGHRQGRLVDRLGQLREPLRARRCRRRADSPPRALRDQLARIAAAQLNVPTRGDRVRRRPRRSQAQSRQQAIVRARSPRPSHWSPGTLPDGIDQAIRETVFWTPPELTAPDEARRDQLLAVPRLHLRFLRRRGRSHHRQPRHRPLRHDARLRPHPASRPWSTGRSAAASPRRSAPRSTRNTPTPPTAAS